MSRPVRVGVVIRMLAARLEAERKLALAEPADDLAWQAGYCEGLREAQHVIRKDS
ncbi:hypothetical protein ATK30_4796 [Amycolatopsis echigonensis]|uniref:Uncharacterized protein n=1 Tax=Amycolatopsis echigonensis TaxID=2576905 RepID=A0A2N3WJA1_9PSEU|nr:hypothetical protein [Amycolatopsis niigatensis]PKV93936.1 hypothetical protein ATK30_4796 [Amycolatopsis niigatensis]